MLHCGEDFVKAPSGVGHVRILGVDYALLRVRLGDYQMRRVEVFMFDTADKFGGLFRYLPLVSQMDRFYASAM